MIRQKQTYILLFSAILFSTQANAILSATTTQEIQGSVPYLTFDSGQTKATNVYGLLGIKLSNGDSYNKDNNTSTKNNPIKLPQENQSIDDVEMYIPKTKDKIALVNLIAGNHFWGDDEGDGDGTNGIVISGANPTDPERELSVTITDKNGTKVARGDKLDGCYAPYKVVLKGDSGILSTQYGLPNSTPFNSVEEIYYIEPNVPTPYTCWAQPNLMNSSKHLSIHEAGYGSWDGPSGMWDADKGFFLQNLNNPSVNFPTMGAKNYYFNLTVSGAKGKDITVSQTPSTIKLAINSIKDSEGNDTNVAQIVLAGPGYESSDYSVTVPVTFTISAKGTVIYRFTINKWFIAQRGQYSFTEPVTGIQHYGFVYDENYCQQKFGSSYRVAKAAELTNANDSANGWSGGLAGQINNSNRRIGGGLFSEWGSTWGTDNFYYWGDIGYMYYWVIEKHGDMIRTVDAVTGRISTDNYDHSTQAHICVTP